MPVCAVKASKIVWYAFGESPEPRTQTLSGPVAAAFLEVAAPEELLELLLHAAPDIATPAVTAAAHRDLAVRDVTVRMGPSASTGRIHGCERNTGG